MREGLRKIAVENSMELSWQEACYYGFFIILSVTKGLGLYEGQKLFELLVPAAFLLAAAKILITPYTRGQWIGLALLFSLTAVVFYHSHERGVWFVAFMVLGMKNISVEKIFRIGLWVWSLCAVVLSVFSFFRLEHTIYRVHTKLGLGHIFRWSLGFTHPNILHLTYLALCAFVIYELGDRYRFRHFVWMMAGNCLIFLYSISYTGFGIVTVLLAGCLYVHFRPRFCIVEKFLANLVFPICLILSFVVPFYLNDNIYAGRVQQLNKLLNTRIWLAEQFLRSDYRSLFGADISQAVGGYMAIDNSYVWCYINYGLVMTVVILLGYCALLLYDTHGQRTRELVILVSFLAAGWTEPLLFNTSFKNLTLLFLGSFLFRRSGGAREYGLFPRMQGAVKIPFAQLPELCRAGVQAVWRGHRGRAVLAAAAGAAVGVLLCAVLYRPPAGYVVPRFYTDNRDEDSVYLTGEDDPAYEGWKVMNYTDAETPMQLVQGNAVRLETVRYYVGSVLIGGLCGVAAGMVYLGRKYAGGCGRKE